MAIDSLRDGFVRLCFDPSQNLIGTNGRVVLEGQYLTTAPDPATADVLTKVTSTADIDNNFGAGSVLAESLKVFLDCCGDSGVELFALPRADAGGAVAAEYTLTVTGPATSDGLVDIYWGDSRYNISVTVLNGDTQDTIAAAIQAAVPADFPYTATVATNVVTFVAKNAGTVGNYLNIDVNWAGRNNYLPEGVAFATAQTVVGATDPAPLADYGAAFGECCVLGYGMLTGDTTWQNGGRLYLEDQWSCDKPQCFGHMYTYNAGALGAILATDVNSAVMSKMAHPDAHPSFPWLRVASYVTKSICQTVDQPQLAVQGPNFGTLDCLRFPETCDQWFTFAEREQLEAAGFVVTVPASGGEGSLTSEVIVGDITNNRFDDEGKQNLTFRSVASRRLAVATADAIAQQFQQFNGLGYFTANTNIAQGVLGTNRNVILGNMRAWAQQQVGTLFSQFDDLTKELTITDDFQTAARCQGVPGKLAMNLTYRPPVRVQEITVNAAPKLLNNC